MINSKKIKEKYNLTSFKKNKHDRQYCHIYKDEINPQKIIENPCVDFIDFSFQDKRTWKYDSPTKSTKAFNQSYSRSRSKSRPRTLNKNDFKKLLEKDELRNEEEEMEKLTRSIFADYAMSFSFNIIPISEMSDSSKRGSINSTIK